MSLTSMYAANWRNMVREHAAEFRIGTEAHAKLGDISRPEGDYMRISGEDEENYYGSWLTGFGFFNVRFPKATTRPLTEAQVEWLADHPVVI